LLGGGCLGALSVVAMLIELEGTLEGGSVASGGLVADVAMASGSGGAGLLAADLVVDRGLAAAALVVSSTLRRAWLDLTSSDRVYPPPPPPEFETLPDNVALLGSGGFPEAQQWSVGATWNVELVYRALDDPDALPSWAGESQGVSRIIRYILGTSGVGFHIVSEGRNDAHTSTGSWLSAGDHVYGDALDVVGLEYGVIDAYTVTDQAHDEMMKIVRFVKQYPQLFTVAVYGGRGGSLSVRDGQTYSGWTQDELNTNSLHIHLASSEEWLRRVLHPSLWRRSGGTVTAANIAATTEMAIAYYAVGVQSSGTSTPVEIPTTVVTPVGSVKSASRVEKTGTAV
jgi:hypothetical protein